MERDVAWGVSPLWHEGEPLAARIVARLRSAPPAVAYLVTAERCPEVVLRTLSEVMAHVERDPLSILTIQAALEVGELHAVYDRHPAA